MCSYRRPRSILSTCTETKNTSFFFTKMKNYLHLKNVFAIRQLRLSLTDKHRFDAAENRVNAVAARGVSNEWCTIIEMPFEKKNSKFIIITIYSIYSDILFVFNT